jgi:hypothetical protein
LRVGELFIQGINDNRAERPRCRYRYIWHRQGQQHRKRECFAFLDRPAQRRTSQRKPHWEHFAAGCAGAAQAADESTRLLLGTATFFGGASAAVALVWSVRSIRRPVSEIGERLESLEQNCVAGLAEGISAFAAGDLTLTVQSVTTHIPDPSNDELGHLARTVNEIIDHIAGSIARYNEARTAMSDLVTAVQRDANGVLVASDGLRVASGQMASTTGQIASAVADVAGRMRARGPGARGMLQVVEVPDCGHAPALNVPTQLEWVEHFITQAAISPKPSLAPA